MSFAKRPRYNRHNGLKVLDVKILCENSYATVSCYTFSLSVFIIVIVETKLLELGLLLVCICVTA